MATKRDPKHGQVLKCSGEDCNKEAYDYEVVGWWTKFRGQHYCFKCSIDNPEINWRDLHLTNLTEELDRRKSKQNILTDNKLIFSLLKKI